ncbi:MAG: c-type cytochrome, partial [Campylobacteraceae bacterium]|nr:c-type cytochrome [Campylobacteraceae bacterium]
EISQKAEDITDDIAQQADKTKEAAQEALKEAADTGRDILQKTNETLSTIGKKADEVINASAKTIDAVKQKTDDIINESADTVDAVKQKAENVVQAAAAPLTNADKGKKLFAICIPCHGAKAEKSAVNKSQIINKWSREQILNALKGYKDGTYGGAFKATMTPTVKRLSDDDMEELSAYIVNLSK